MVYVIRKERPYMDRWIGIHNIEQNGGHYCIIDGDPLKIYFYLNSIILTQGFFSNTRMSTDGLNFLNQILSFIRRGHYYNYS